jgi:hypothetical protein
METEDWRNTHDLSPEERKEAEHSAKFVEVIVNDIITSREMLTDSKLIAVEKLVESEPELIKDFLDDRFTRDLIDKVSGCVDRTLQLSRLQASGKASSITNGYLREAVRTYILGLPQASVALSRAALEQALKEGIGYQSTHTFIEMNDLLDEAESARVIDRTVRKMARELADDADDVLHEKPTTLAKAYEVLVKLRGVFQHVYAEP